MLGMGILQLFPFVSYLFYILIPLAPIAYIFIKWRAARNNEPHDRDLGTKVVFYYFQTLAYQVILIGLVLVLFGLLKGSLKDEMKSGVALVFSGGLVYIIHTLAIHKAFKTDQVRIVPRFYAGFNLLVVGLVGMVCFIAVVLILINDKFENTKIPLSGLVVYGVAWIFRTLEFVRGAGKKAARGPADLNS
jgi:hypothetical protein